jgi:hypothetical protein
MAFPDNNDPLKNARPSRRFKGTTAWSIAGGVVLLVLAFLVITPARQDKSAENPPHPATQSPP